MNIQLFMDNEATVNSQVGELHDWDSYVGT